MSELPKNINSIICDDVLSGLKKIEDSSVHLIFSSPPYNLDIDYATRDDNEPYKNYISWLEEILIECKRVLVDGGRIAINIDAMTNRQDDKDKEYVRPIYADLVNIGRKIGLNFRAEICWYKQNAVGRKTAWGSYMSASNPIMRRNHEYIIVWSKGPWRLEGDSELSDMTKEEFEQWTLSTWFIQPETKNMNGHPCPFPIELARRVIKLFSYRDNVVLDIFNGTGTTCCSAKMEGRNYIGIDNDHSHCDFAYRRLGSIVDIMGTAKTRSELVEEGKQKKKSKETYSPDVFG